MRHFDVKAHELASRIEVGKRQIIRQIADPEGAAGAHPVETGLLRQVRRGQGAGRCDVDVAGTLLRSSCMPAMISSLR